ncbi:hypothetical protein H9P43_002399 [Blastocladiella emersonii ATCC 22665]|nr:hypothetical protein H9P43_002399 [Blastocladiella emersonii ATCC 22665]
MFARQLLRTTARVSASATPAAAARAATRGAAFRFVSTASSTKDVTSADRECYVTPLQGDDAGISVISLNRPKAKNALSRQFLAEFRECLAHLRADPATRVVVVRSLVDKVFCAGADLKERKTMTPDEVSSFVSSLRASFSELQNLRTPTIAALDGAALGGGLELALCCDLRAAGTGARLGLPETKLAIIPGAGGTQRLPRLIGVPRAKELMFTGRVVLPEEALQIALVNRVAERGEDAAIALAREIVPQGPIALRMAKRAVDEGTEVDLASGLAIEQKCYAQVIPTQDRLEGLKAFAEKRKPQYKGQ